MQTDNLRIFILNENTIDEWNDIMNEVGFPLNSSMTLQEIAQNFSLPFTVCCEANYVDQFYRDLYYNYYSSKFYTYQRDCLRISFFKGKISPDMLCTYNDKVEKNLQESFYGCLIIRPLQNGPIGRTYISFEKINIPSSFILSTIFHFYLFGHELSVRAFPFSQQDQEYLTCAETVLWNITEYFGTQYPEYKTILPSSIIDAKNTIQTQRVLPSLGIDSYEFSKILMTFGFAPRIYDSVDYLDAPHDNSSCNIRKLFKRSIYYYIESGIPLALEVTHNSNANHMITCIGHVNGYNQFELKSNIVSLDDAPYVFIADLFQEFVVMDDNSSPYSQICLKIAENKKPDHDEEIDSAKLNITPNIKTVERYIVPLYKRILMDSFQADTLVTSLLSTKQWSFSNFFPKSFLSYENPITIRIFLTSSRQYKATRSIQSTSPAEAQFYLEKTFPKYIWVAELALLTDYTKGEIQGEIVLDATYPIDRISSQNFLDSVLLIRYMNNTCDLSNRDKNYADFYTDSNLSETFKQFNRNLNKGGI